MSRTSRLAAGIMAALIFTACASTRGEPRGQGGPGRPEGMQLSSASGFISELSESKLALSGLSSKASFALGAKTSYYTDAAASINDLEVGSWIVAEAKASGKGGATASEIRIYAEEPPRAEPQSRQGGGEPPSGGPGAAPSAGGPGGGEPPSGGPGGPGGEAPSGGPGGPGGGDQASEYRGQVKSVSGRSIVISIEDPRGGRELRLVTDAKTEFRSLSEASFGDLAIKRYVTLRYTARGPGETRNAVEVDIKE